MDNLLSLFAQTLNVPAADLSDESSPETVAKWDSLAAMNLVAAIEERYQIRLTTREIMSMRTIGTARDVLKRKGVDPA